MRQGPAGEGEMAGPCVADKVALPGYGPTQ